MTTVHYGLVEIGGFVRHTELTKQQRESMLVQERANLVLFNMRQRAPDTTDVSMASARPSGPLSSSARPTAADGNLNQEGGEEELPTEDENMDGPDGWKPRTRT